MVSLFPANLLTVEEASSTGLSFHNDQRVKRCPSSVSNKGFSVGASIFSLHSFNSYNSFGD